MSPSQQHGPQSERQASKLRHTPYTSGIKKFGAFVGTMAISQLVIQGFNQLGRAGGAGLQFLGKHTSSAKEAKFLTSWGGHSIKKGGVLRGLISSVARARTKPMVTTMESGKTMMKTLPSRNIFSRAFRSYEGSLAKWNFLGRATRAARTVPNATTGTSYTRPGSNIVRFAEIGKRTDFNVMGKKISMGVGAKLGAVTSNFFIKTAFDMPA